MRHKRWWIIPVALVTALVVGFNGMALAQVSPPIGPNEPESTGTLVVTPLSMLLIGAGESGTFEASPGSTDAVEWKVEDPQGNFKYQVDGNRLTVSAMGPVGSATVIARRGDESFYANVVAATPGPRTRRLPTGSFQLDGDRLLRVDRNPETSLIQVGDVLVSDTLSAERPGLLARVTSVMPAGDFLMLRFQASSIAGAFQSFSANLQGKPQTIGEFQSAAQMAGGEMECTITGSGEPQVEVSLFNVEGEALTITPNIQVVVDWFRLTSMNVSFITETNLTFTGPSVDATWEGRVTVTCIYTFSGIPLGVIAAGPLTFKPELTPSISLTGDITTGESSISLVTARLTYEASGEYGVNYCAAPCPNPGWKTVKRHESPGPRASGPEITVTPSDSADLKLVPSVDLAIGMGVGALGIDVVDIGLFTATFGIEARLNLPYAAILYNAPPIDLRHRNPEWRLIGWIDIALDLGADWGEAVRLADPQTPGFSTHQILFHTEVPMGRSPMFTLELTGTPRAGAVTMSVNPGRQLTPLESLVYKNQKVRFYGMKQAWSDAELIGEVPMDEQGRASYTLILPEPELVGSGSFGTTHNVAFPGEYGHWYRARCVDMGPEAAVMLARYVLAPSDPVISMCWNTSLEGSVGLSLGQSHYMSFVGGTTGTGQVWHLGEGYKIIIALVDDTIYAPLTLESFTDAKTVPFN